MHSWSQERKRVWKSQTSCSGSVTGLLVIMCRLGNMSVAGSPCSCAPSPAFTVRLCTLPHLMHACLCHRAECLPHPHCSCCQILLATADLLDNLSGRDFYCPTHSAPVVTDVVSHRRLQMPCTPGTASMGPRGA